DQTMRTLHLVTLLTAALSLAPLTAFAATPAEGKADHQTHATTGLVKAIDATTLVLSRPNKKKGDLSFTLNGSTRRDGAIVVGAPVSVRYQNEGKSHLATAIAVRPAGVAAAHK
ncbi:MAG: hypothetical protein ABL982_26540, partial [Vicinamibacterales bacterium]